MTTLRFARGFVVDYARTSVNMLLLVVVPVVFVGVVANSLANFAKLLGSGLHVETVTAGWAAALVAGNAMYFQIAATRDVDRRVVTTGFSAARLVLARLLSGVALAVMASIAALVALAVRTGIGNPVRVVVGTMMFALIYIAVGAVVGSFVANPVNGTVIVLFVWIVDVFFGPAMGAADRVATRGFPTHFVTLWMVDVPSHHSGRIGDLGWALGWTLAAAIAAWAVTASRTRTARPRVARVRQRRSSGGQLAAARRAAWRDARRNPALWVLFIVVPVVFILGAAAVTPDKPITVALREHGHRITSEVRMPDVHGATMAPIAVAALAALVGLFTMLDSRDGDRRVTLAGLRSASLLTARLGVLAAAAMAATGAALLTTAVVFDATNWPTYAAANVLLALTYGLVGALLAPIFGRVGGVFVAFLLPFLDIGIVQSPMLHPDPTTLSRFLPGYGGSRVLLDGALTVGFDETRALFVGLSWLLVLGLAVCLTYRASTRGTLTRSR
ncbi:MAG: ABC transporter permease [Actinomycetota bacterium]